VADVFFRTEAALVVYVYAGYPCLIFLLARLRPRPVRKAPVLPPVSFIIAAYNEERVIAAKLENTFALDYPPERLEVMVVSDGSTDATEEIVRTRFAGRVKLIALPRQGKTLAQNQAVAVARGEIVVFSDATTVYQPASLRALVANFADPEVGCVTGTTIYGTERAAAVGEGRAAYWNYERFVRSQESRFCSVLGASGSSSGCAASSCTTPGSSSRSSRTACCAGRCPSSCSSPSPPTSSCSIGPSTSSSSSPSSPSTAPRRSPTCSSGGTSASPASSSRSTSAS